MNTFGHVRDNGGPAVLTRDADTGTTQFGVRRHDHHGAVMLSVFGTVDVVTTPTLATHLDTALAGQPALVIVDLLQVDLLSASGINLLVEAHRLTQPAGTSLRVVAHGRTTSRLMHLIGVDEVIDVYPTVHDALGNAVSHDDREEAPQMREIASKPTHHSGI